MLDANRIDFNFVTTRRDGDEFRYPILIIIEKIHLHPRTQTQPVSNFCLVLIFIK